jgi:hypothetical protein
VRHGGISYINSLREELFEHHHVTECAVWCREGDAWGVLFQALILARLSLNRRLASCFNSLAMVSFLLVCTLCDLVSSFRSDVDTGLPDLAFMLDGGGLRVSFSSGSCCWLGISAFLRFDLPVSMVEEARTTGCDTLFCCVRVEVG